MSERRRLVMDLDGTLCEQVDTRTSPDGIRAYRYAAPKRDVIAQVNRLHREGWIVTIHTARGMRTFSHDVQQVERYLRELTEDWLSEHGVEYHRLVFGKPPADLYVDDKSLRPDEFSSEDH